MKKGLSHIEMILSFVIFVGAVGFALYFFSPVKTSRLVDTSLEYVGREISDNISVNLRTYSLKLNNSNGQIGNDLVVRITDLCKNNANDIARVENISGSTFPVDISHGSSRCGSGTDDVLKIKNENGWNRPEDFIYIKLNEDFGENPSNLSSGLIANPVFYDESTSDSKSLFSEKRISMLGDFYFEDYLRLKEQFNLPGRVNFGFSIVFSDGTRIEAERPIPNGLDVFSKIERVEILRENGDIEYADLTLRVW